MGETDSSVLKHLANVVYSAKDCVPDFRELRFTKPCHFAGRNVPGQLTYRGSTWNDHGDMRIRQDVPKRIFQEVGVGHLQVPLYSL